MISRHNLQSSDWWKFRIWNRVMGSQPINIQLGKILQENLAGNSCGKILRENSCGRILQENLVGQGGGEKANLRKAVIGGNLAFGIRWFGANQSRSSSGKSCGKILQEMLQEIMWENLWKILWEYLVGKSCQKICGKSCQNICGKSCWKCCGKCYGKSCRKFNGKSCMKILKDQFRTNFEANFENMQVI